MSDVVLNISTENELSINLAIDGTKEKPSSVRLCVDGESLKYVFDGVASGDSGDYSFTIPKLSGKISSGIHNGRVEVIIEDKIFVPMELEVELTGDVKVSATIHPKEDSDKKQGVGVSATIKTATATIEQPAQKQITKEAYDISLRKVIEQALKNREKA